MFGRITSNRSQLLLKGNNFQLWGYCWITFPYLHSQLCFSTNQACLETNYGNLSTVMEIIKVIKEFMSEDNESMH